MKHVRTARSYRSLTVDVGTEDNPKQLTVTGEPLEVSDENADKLEKAGASVGVEVLVFDEADDAREGTVHRAARSGVAPDLSAGIAVITGTGDPVSTPGTTPDGGEPEQAGQAAGGTATPTDTGGAADQPSTPAVSARSGKPAAGTTTTEGN